MKQIFLTILLLIFSNCDIVLSETNKAIFLETDLLTFPLTKSKSMNYHLLNICIGIPKTCFNLMFDTTSSYLWVPGKYITEATHQYDPDKSSTSKETHNLANISDGSGRVIDGYFVYDDIYFNGNTKVNYKFVAAAYKAFFEDNYEGIIGFSNDPGSNDPQSILGKLYADGKISNQVYSIKADMVEDAKLYVGDYHSDFKKDYAKCYSTKKEPWICSISQINMKADGKSKSFPFKEKTTVSFTTRYAKAVIASFKIGYEILSAAIENFIDKAKCRYYDNELAALYFCDKDSDFDAFPDFEFILDGYGLKIPGKSLIKCEDSICHVDFVLVKSSPVDFMFGIEFMNNFHVLFDNYNYVIGFQGDFNTYEVPGGSSSALIIVGVVIACVVVLFLIVFAVMKCLRKSREETSLSSAALINNNRI
jgi:hypothetical protein